MNHREYFNQVAGKWDKMTTPETILRLREIVKVLSIRSGDTILDVGGGTGIILPLLCEFAGDKSKIISLDIAEEMLKHARNNGYSGNMHYVHADATAIPLAGETFDFVICYSCFPHFLDKREALAEMSRVLRKDGRLVICHTASRKKINALHKSLGGVVGNDNIPDDATMHKMLTASGLERIKVQDEAHQYVAIGFKA